MKSILNNSFRLNKVLIRIMLSKAFISISVVGNTVILCFSMLFYHLESPQNPEVNEYLDALWWAFSTATTVGYGDIIPMTTLGKILGIFLMLVGTALFATYTAIFAQSILEDDFFNQESKTAELFKELKKNNKLLEKLTNDSPNP